MISRLAFVGGGTEIELGSQPSGIEAVVLGPEDSKHGAVESRADSRNSPSQNRSPRRCDPTALRPSASGEAGNHIAGRASTPLSRFALLSRRKATQLPNLDALVFGADHGAGCRDVKGFCKFRKIA